MLHYGEEEASSDLMLILCEVLYIQQKPLGLS